MDYRNKFYEMLKRINDNCENCSCCDCIFYMEDKCAIRDLFQELSFVAPFEYEETYIDWFIMWEAKYNELYE